MKTETPAKDLLAEAVKEAYRFITQPVSGTRNEIVYACTAARYNELTEKLRAGMRANEIEF